MERDTQQRRAIRWALKNANRPLGPQEVLSAAQVECPRLGIATVYRNIKSFLQTGWLSQVELPGEPARYELAGKGHHHHFRCRSCEGVFDLHGCPDSLRAMIPEGFRLESHEVTLYGQCGDCVA